jgi:hypothetical protein
MVLRGTMQSLKEHLSDKMSQCMYDDYKRVVLAVTDRVHLYPRY